MSLGKLFHYFNLLRYSAGIALMLDAYPIIFFIRDTLKIGPSGSIFTALFLGMSLVIMIPFHLFTRIYKPNYTLLKYGVLFLVLILYHFFLFNNSGTDKVMELGYNLYIIIFLFLLLHVPNEVKDWVIPLVFIVSLFGNLTLIYSLMTDPAWRIGMRAAVTLSSEDSGSTSNPHIAARNGVICFFSALLLIRQYSNLLIKLFLYFMATVSFALIIFAQVKSSILGLGIAMAFYIYFNVSVSSFISSVQRLFSIRNILLLMLIFVGINLFLSSFGDVYGHLLGYTSALESKAYDIFFTATGVQLGNAGSIDDSAMGRVSTFFYFKQTLIYSPSSMFIGQGYKDVYMDIPMLEAFLNHGIFGLVFFGGFNLYAFIFSVREIKRPTNSLTTFLAYFYIYLITLLFTTGRPYDTYFWFPFVIMIRFLGIRYLDSSIPVSVVAVDSDSPVVYDRSPQQL